MKTLALALTLVASAAAAQSTSYYPTRLNDAEAVYVPAPASASVDSTAALQTAIDTVQQTPRHQGIVFVPSGTYRITHTVYVWPGVRVIGYGATRPTFLLPANTPGYQKGMGYMLFFTGGRKGDGRDRQGLDTPFPGTVPPAPGIIDGNPGTFYSAISNVDLEIGSGNPSAVGIRFHIAQHCYMAHMDFRIGSGLAGIHDVGNEAEDLHFHGGTYGIMTRKPSPGWQFTLIDSSFDHQREAAIKEHEAGLTLIHDTFTSVPTAVSIDPGYSDELWIRGSRLVDLSGPAIVISNENNPRTEINLEEVIATNVPKLAFLRESKREIPGQPYGSYLISSFTSGLIMADGKDPGEIKSTIHAEGLALAPKPLVPALTALPSPSTWVNIRDLGAKGDGHTDDTAVFQKAIAEHKTIYVPMGYYLVSDTLELKPDTVLVALHPSRTQIFLADGTPAFNGPGAPKALIHAPAGGANIVSGIGLSTNGQNNRAVAALWESGVNSLMSDTRFLGGHGTQNPDGSPNQIYNQDHSADPNPARKWDTQSPSLWITNNGGGTFSNIWTPSTFTSAGLLVSNTTTPGHIYELSSEHHVRNEVKFDHAANWSIYALQTEEERGEGGATLPIEISNSHDLTFANFHSYRVVSSFQPSETAVRVTNSKNIRFRNMHIYSDSKVSFNNALLDESHRITIRQREIASLTLTGDESDATKPAAPPAFIAGAVEKLATGFFNISGPAVDPHGTLYFTDPHTQHIYRYNATTKKAETLRDASAPIDPANLAFDHAGNLLITSYTGTGTVYALKVSDPKAELQTLKPVPSKPEPGKTAILPVDFWRFENDFKQGVPVKKAWHFVSPDGTTFLPAGDDFIKGSLYYGIKMEDILRGFSLTKVKTGDVLYISDESEHKTYSTVIAPDGTLTDLDLFADRGGEGVTSDAHGNVYIAEGQIYLYNPEGDEVGMLEVPERPIALAIGGTDNKTLYILARTSLYSVRLK
ncbi:glycosyl hydrolase family 28-related protein [Terriglobus saanensis]|uniref:SMP-30/Gluconolaconase/LRE-like region-containing protein n=1 Tax=Terriglobus saanensis (strain ATCC BAA-1853 / DSM 23119 / SP1PR4) TaxID=401053 RepID=E8V5A5_TERSS|nr:glycosyl hydrolase family 28-related protein [Terriglobus saanensis]ADV84864.1 SMP-30/Gluconolaconase/LRE-like region-containing protein [Terriglobus saanensis SP1PR4]